MNIINNFFNLFSLDNYYSDEEYTDNTFFGTACLATITGLGLGALALYKYTRNECTKNEDSRTNINKAINDDNVQLFEELFRKKLINMKEHLHSEESLSIINNCIANCIAGDAIQILNSLYDQGTALGQPKVSSMYLFAAIHCNRKKILKFLLGIGVNVNCQDSMGMPPLYYAVKNGFEECVEILIQHGAKPNLRVIYGLSLLAHAKSNEIKKILIENADIRDFNQNEAIIALRWAVETGNHAVFQKLLEHKALMFDQNVIDKEIRNW